MLTPLGDDEGVFARHPDGSPAPAELGPTLSLYRDGQLFRHEAQSTEADVRPADNSKGRFADPRCFGLTTGYPANSLAYVLFDPQERSLDAVRFTEQRDGHLHLVRCIGESYEIRFWIDAEKDWNAVRVQSFVNGDLIAESRTALKQYGDGWFPERIEMLKEAFRNGKEPAEIIRVDSVEFNRPEHSARLTPYDIGIDVGTVIRQVDAANRTVAMMRWDGEKIVTGTEFTRRMRAGELQVGPKFLEAADHVRQISVRNRNAADPAALASRPRGLGTWSTCVSEWERYTLEFIRRYRLDDGQRERAMSILKQCQEQAAPKLAERRPQFARLDEDIAALVKLPPAEQAARRSDLRRRIASLMAPIDDIFEDGLKPRLEKLPSRAQRQEAAASAPATR
ncbi:hypothetical protein RAS1_29190 [Phycisphaerae bacterium RAS1]|nr:hypothetical protein RAS1_29190 [Phycisphaerae bacterium RAS1]